MRLKHEATAPESLHMRSTDARALLSLPSSRHNLLTGRQSPQYPLLAVKNLIPLCREVLCGLGDLTHPKTVLARPVTHYPSCCCF